MREHNFYIYWSISRGKIFHTAHTVHVPSKTSPNTQQSLGEQISKAQMSSDAQKVHSNLHHSHLFEKQRPLSSPSNE